MQFACMAKLLFAFIYMHNFGGKSTLLCQCELVQNNKVKQINKKKIAPAD